MGAVTAEPGIGTRHMDGVWGIEGLGWPSTAVDIQVASLDRLEGKGGTSIRLSMDTYL